MTRSEQWQGCLHFTLLSWLFPSWICSFCSATWSLKLSVSTFSLAASVWLSSNAAVPPLRATKLILTNVSQRLLNEVDMIMSEMELLRNSESHWKFPSDPELSSHEVAAGLTEVKETRRCKNFLVCPLKVSVCANGTHTLQSRRCWLISTVTRSSVHPSVWRWERHLFVMLSPVDMYAGNRSEFFNRMMSVVLDCRGVL